MSNINQHTDRIQQAHKITNRKTMYAAGAGLIPFPIVDVAALLAVQLDMIKSIADLYDIEFKEHLAKSLIGSLVTGISAVGLVKLIPGLGTVLGGISSSVTGAASTYALGRVFTMHFAQGGTLLDFDPASSREHFQKEFEEGKAIIEEKGLKEETQADDFKATVHHDVKKELLVKESKKLQLAISKMEQKLSLLLAKQTNETVSNLTIIEGIGEETNILLNKAGIDSIECLSKTEVSKLEAILKSDAQGRFNFSNPSTWPKQAALVLAGELEKLKELKKTIKN